MKVGWHQLTPQYSSNSCEKDVDVVSVWFGPLPAQPAAGKQGAWPARAAGVAQATSRPERSQQHRMFGPNAWAAKGAAPGATVLGQGTGPHDALRLQRHAGWRSRTHGLHEIYGLTPGLLPVPEKAAALVQYPGVDLRRGGHHVAGPQGPLPAGYVAHHPARFLDQQNPGGQIPGL